MTSDSPDISIVITVVSGASHLEACLQGLAVQQGCDPGKVEIIVPFDRRDQEISSLKSVFPDVIFHATRLSLDAPAWLSHENFDDLRAVGLRLANGKIIAMLIDHEIPDPSWCRNMLEEHAALPHAAIGGPVENSIDRPINWATYFFDFGRYQSPVNPGASSFLTDVNIGYKREALDDIRHVWEHRFHEPYVHGALLAGGQTLWLSPAIVVHQNREGLKLSEVIRERHVWGRYFAGNRVAARGLAMRMTYCAFSPAIPFIILGKMLFNVMKKKRLRGKFFLALPYTLLLTVAWSWGEFVGYATNKPGAFRPAGPD